MKIRIYHELNGTVRIVKVVEQGPEKGKESSMFHNLKPGSMAEVEIDAVLQHQACMKESKSESKEKDDSCNLQKFLQVYAPDMPYITVKKTASKMKISVEDAEKNNCKMQRIRITRKYICCLLSALWALSAFGEWNKNRGRQEKTTCYQKMLRLWKKYSDGGRRYYSSIFLVEKIL